MPVTWQMKIPNGPQGAYNHQMAVIPGKELERVKDKPEQYICRRSTFNQPFANPYSSEPGIYQQKNNKVMDKETYVKRVQELNHIRQKALEYNEKEKAKADESYIKENCPFKIGDRVKQGENIGTIEEIRVHNDGLSFEYTIRKEKKRRHPCLKICFKTFSLVTGEIM